MASKIKLKYINEILKENFFIPSYQRGYRWNEQNVEDLLNDLDDFKPQTINDKETWYCLQPLVLRKNHSCKDEDLKNWFEVIDGQQRLTTSLLIIHYFNEMWVGKQKIQEFGLAYETRGKNDKFFDELEVGENDNVKINNTDIDAYHISLAYQTIHNWVKNKGDKFDNNNFQSKFLHSTQFIWYETENGNNPIETFIRINMGKIPLTNSELIKALFLQKRKFENNEIAELRQIEIASEWDRIEYSFQNDNFWWFLNKNKNDIPARIEFLLDLICSIAIDEDSTIIKKIGTDRHATFRYFYNKFSNSITITDVIKEWNNIKDYYLAFEEWYEKPIWYHYIGFLIYCGNDISAIYRLYRNSTKEEFTQKLKTNIKTRFDKIECTKIINGDSLEYYNIELEFSNKNKPKIRELLLLYNLQFIINQHESILDKNNAETYLKFPFKLFKEENWDVEHIDSFTSNSLSSYEAQKEWLSISINDLKKINGEIEIELDSKIKDFKGNPESTFEFNELRNAVIKLAGEDINNEEIKNGIGNLTLLNSDINRSYGNSLFPTKRRIIIEKDNEGKFIPICTKHVFLKYFDKNGISSPNWKESDISNYQTNIGEILSSFLNIKTK